MNPDVQEKLIKEIDDAVGDGVSTVFNCQLTGLTEVQFSL